MLIVELQELKTEKIIPNVECDSIAFGYFQGKACYWLENTAFTIDEYRILRVSIKK